MQLNANKIQNERKFRIQCNHNWILWNWFLLRTNSKLLTQQTILLNSCDFNASFFSSEANFCEYFMRLLKHDSSNFFGKLLAKIKTSSNKHSSSFSYGNCKPIDILNTFFFFKLTKFMKHLLHFTNFRVAIQIWKKFNCCNLMSWVEIGH
jgi:hypothetical protein